MVKINRAALLEILIASNETVIPHSIAAPIIGSDPITLRMCVRERPEKLGFPVIMIGTRVKIPRLPFIAFLKGKQEDAP